MSRLGEMRRLLALSAADRDPNPERSHITGQEHALRCAWQGRRRGHSPEMALIGLVHDLGRPLNDVHHGEVVAEMVRDRVSFDAYKVLYTHGTWQADVMHGTRSRRTHGQTSWYPLANQLCAFEVASFAPSYPAEAIMSLEDADALLELTLA